MARCKFKAINRACPKSAPRVAKKMKRRGLKLCCPRK